MSQDREEILRVEDLHVSFGPKKVLCGLSLSICRGDNYVIIGPSGIGKSVLLRHIFGLLKPDSGRIFLWGTDIVPLDENELAPFRARMAIVFQEGALFHSMTVEENISLALVEVHHVAKERVKEIVAEKLEMVNLSGTEHLRISELSGGMKKRVAVARALALEPEIIFYDEPTTGLDPPLADSVDELIYTLSRRLKNTTVTVTHDMIAARYFGDRVGLMNKGRIGLECSTEELERIDNDVIQSFLHRKEHHEENLAPVF